MQSAEATIYSALIQQASFHAFTNRIYSRIMSTPAPTAAESLTLDADLVRWYDSVPQYLRPTLFPTIPHWLGSAQHKVFWRHCNLRIILHRRAFLERALKGLSLWSDDKGSAVTAEEECTRLCLSSAADTIRSIHQFTMSRPRASRLECWYAL